MNEYYQKALSIAEFDVLDGIDAYFGHIPGFDGVYVYSHSFSVCRTKLASVLNSWINLRLSEGLPLPAVLTRTQINFGG